MDVLLVAPLFPPDTGGIQTVMKNFAIHTNHSLTVLTEKDKGDPSLNSDATIVKRKFSGLRGRANVLRWIVRHQAKFDLIYFCSIMPFLSAPASRFKNVVVHSHGREVIRNRPFISKVGFAVATRSGVNFIAVSDWTKQALLDSGAERDRMQVIHNGTDYQRFATENSESNVEIPINDEMFTILTVSRLDPRKGHDIVLDAIAGVSGVEYLIVGSGEQQSELQEKVQSLGIQNRVRFAGYVPDDELPAYYNLSDAFVMPARHIEETGNIEGFGISFLESNAAGTAVIGSDTGGIPSAIKDGKTGLLCEPSPDSVQETILRLKDNEDLRIELEQNGIEWAKEHDWPSIVDEIDDALVEFSC
ncbi:glycosyltransferase family 4 protein [Halosimplex litoreum]|uniref:Glycosyltransferase family 4 protein n=1 Tax=Halosimplex litoreum TaxID=1198301 RepID=A0A7T3KWP0_9EURY|nr:glycosyltransferase family 4 protein [Halosimplex litoreum]QPV64344.1 glycosyltransferase family 4 protein [Halosimplex litoreum]